MDYYTNVTISPKGKILYRGLKNGKRVTEELQFSPSLFILSDKKSKFSTHDGRMVSEVNFDTIYEAKEFIKKYTNVPNFEIFGNQNWEYVFIGKQHPKDISWKFETIRIANIDIEVGSENGFPNVETANEPIVSIAGKIGNQTVCFGCGEWTPSENDVTYVKCNNEKDLLERFLKFWSADYPDIITGWYIQFFDIPYLVHRIKKILGDESVRKLSPWKYVSSREVTLMGKDHKAYNISGIAILDYIELFRKFHPEGAAQENYKLDYICSKYIGEKKLSYEEYGNLHTLYRENFSKFMDYNLRDIKLIEKLDHKERLLELAVTLAYDSKVNYADVFQQTRMWDALIYNALWSKNIILQPKETIEKTPFEGAYVKQPQIGRHNWVVSFDLASLYPHLMMQYNISPDTLVEPKFYNDDMSEFISQPISVENLLYKKIDTSILKNHSVTVTPNGQLFSINKKGFMTEILENMFNDRQRYKGMMIDAEKELVEAEKNKKDNNVIEQIKDKIARYKNLQQVKKICLNSCYGALGNEYFRFFDVRQAAAVTTSGQLSIRWIINSLNDYLNRLLKTTNEDYIIASDTDSVYITLDKLVDMVFKNEKKSEISSKKKILDFLDKACKTQIQPFINKSYEDLASYVNAYAQKMSMKREKICDVGIAIAGKNYIWNIWDKEGVRYEEPKIDAVGLKMIKSNTPEIAREKLKNVLKYIVSDDEDELQKYMENFRKEFFQQAPEDIATPTSMKGLYEYSDKVTIYKKGTGIHIRGSLLYNKFLSDKKLDTQYPTIQDGEKIKYVYLKLPNPLKDNVISFPTILPKEFGLHHYIDYETQFEKAVISPLKAVLDVIGWSVKKEENLMSFFDE